MEKNNMLMGNNFNNNNNASFVKPLGNRFENNQFVNKNKEFQERMSNIQSQKNIFTQDIKTQQHINPTNKNDMYDKTLALLHERLQQGSITLEEFNKKCRDLAKKRQN